MNHSVITRECIAAAYGLIRPFIRRTPIIEVEGAEFGLGAFRSFLKLEFLQHAGSFKARGAFANLLMRKVPAAGVVAASGGNHGVAVAYAAMRLGKPARIFVPRIASPAKMARIREFKAQLVVTGERYADALAESQTWAASSGALQVHAYDQVETLLGQGLKIPEDISVAGFGNILLGAHFCVPLTTTRQPKFRLGLAAVDAMQQLLRGQRPEPKRLPAELIIRASTGTPPATSRLTQLKL